MPCVIETRLPVLAGDLRLAVRLWAPDALRDAPVKDHPRRALAYPGWLDNAGSFDSLAPLLCEQLNMTVACIDPPGCGHSDHRGRSSVYSDFEEAPLLGEVADQLGWETYVLIGHSRGGAVTAWAAGLSPKRVLCLVSIETNFGLSGQWIRDLLPDAPQAPDRMAGALAQLKRNLVRDARVFETLQEAIDANADNDVFKKSPASARNIVLRHIRPHPQGWTFTHDPKTYGQSQFLHVTDEHSRKFFERIACPVLHIVRSASAWTSFPKPTQENFEQRLSWIKNRELVVVEGGHHVHTDRPRSTAKVVVPWLERKLAQVESKL
jgi:pimeloyl-ACP methyl ester carboxylesterase